VILLAQSYKILDFSICLKDIARTLCLGKRTKIAIKLLREKLAAYNRRAAKLQHK
jgi:hypothetical protein